MNCIKCRVDLTEKNKVKDRNSCIDCERKRKKEYTQNKKNELENKVCELCINKKIQEYCDNCKKYFLKKCSKCNESKLANKYNSIHSKVCKVCTPKSQNITKEEWLNLNADIKEKECITCNKIKNINDFSYHTNNFRNQCKECILKKKYYQTYRDKKRNEDEKAFLEHNNKVHTEWKQKNKEKYKEYYTKYNKTLNRHVNNAISKARKKQNITENDKSKLHTLFSNLMISNCAYCGINNVNDNKYNGIDRIDSTKCYNFNNCNPCCNKCNMVKNTMDIGSFLRKCVEISLYNNLNKICENDYRLKFHENILLVNNSDIYRNYKSKAKSKNLIFDITKDEYLNIVKNNCYLCGKTNKENSIGIDRVNNNLGYILSNCKSCCNYCNFMKKNLSLEEFLKHVQKIVTYTTENEQFKNNEYNFCKILQKTKDNFPL